MTDLEIDCAGCGARYSAYVEACPACNTPNPYIGVKSRKGIYQAIAIGAGVVAIIAALFVFPNLIVGQGGGGPLGGSVNILRPETTAPQALPQKELVQSALDAINKDRREFGLPPVKLSNNSAAQIHAEDVFGTKQISHWTTGGEKPYMTYANHGGTGSVHQNVAIAGFGPDEYQNCSALMIICERIDPVAAIKELEYEMMYNDEDCCDNGHRENILDPHHTHVSIGISYDSYYLSLVQNFENNYGLDITVDEGYVSMIGDMPEGAELDHVVVYYDKLPTPAAYEANKKMISYSTGEIAASVFAPLPDGLRYQQPKGYVVIEADGWIKNDALDISFDLEPAIKEPGVYTLYTMFKDKDGDQFSITSYSVFVESVDATAGQQQ